MKEYRIYLNSKALVSLNDNTFHNGYDIITNAQQSNKCYAYKGGVK